MVRRKVTLPVEISDRAGFSSGRRLSSSLCATSDTLISSKLIEGVPAASPYTGYCTRRSPSGLYTISQRVCMSSMAVPDVPPVLREFSTTASGASKEAVTGIVTQPSPIRPTPWSNSSTHELSPTIHNMIARMDDICRITFVFISYLIAGKRIGDFTR